MIYLFYVHYRAFSRHSVSCEHIDVQASHNDISESRRSRRSSMSNNQHSIKGIIFMTRSDLNGKCTWSILFYSIYLENLRHKRR